MFSKVFLAQTSYEMNSFSAKNTAYMACHFSNYTTGLSNCPTFMPPKGFLLLDDSLPVFWHIPETVIGQLKELVERFSVSAVLLDFQADKTAESEAMAAAIVNALPCPVAVTEAYAKNLDCPVFLQPCPITVPLSDYLAPWKGRKIYLEAALDGLQITVTPHTSSQSPLPPGGQPLLPLSDERLHCHYQVEVSAQKAVFTLARSRKDLAALLEEAYSLGIDAAVGLYQELMKE